MAVADVAPSPPIAQPISRVDGKLKVTGTARYAAEFTLPNLVYGQLIQSTIANGRVVSIDSAAAKSAPGVVGILTRENAPRFKPYSEQLTKKGGPGESRVPLQDDEVHWVGQHLGVIVADTFENAQQAASLVRVQYAAAPPLLAMDSSAAEKESWLPEYVFGREKLQNSRGDVESALGSASAQIDATYTTPIENHNPIETYSTLAMWEAPDRLLIHEATRGIKQLQKIVANAFSLPVEHVRIISPFVGGAFGSKGFQWSHTLLTAAAARLVNRPVKLTFARPQMFDSAGQRAHTSQALSLAANHDAKLVVLRHATITHCSPVSEYAESCGLTSRMLYSCPNVQVSHRLVRLNLTTPCPMRAPGEAPGVFALECAMDELAQKLSIDPVELRLRNYADTDENEKRPWTSKHLRECYERGAKIFGWAKRNPQPNSTRAKDGSRIGWGMATAIYPANQQTATAKATLTSNGDIVIRSATHEIGTGTYTAMSQLAASALGLPLESIRFELGDSDFPEAPNNGGSWQTASVGPAVLGVCAELKKQMFAAATKVLDGATPDQMELTNGVIRIKNDPARSVSLRELRARAGLPWIEAEWKAEPNKEEREKFSFYSFGAIFIEVGVDDFGQTRVNRVVSVYDVGRILNPKLARSQIMSGNLFGIGMALMEETIPDAKIGRNVNPNLAEYHVPVCADVPALEIDFINEPDPRMPDLGARGIGEIGIVGAPAAVANAIFHATGKRVRDLPITPDKLI
ncbi:MAG: xanthine dehydrogenase YagR molybdenum-binding subunit [Verrucomicrobiota bacterium]|jgi:xanthine dehydrogenase YagR molybdenum-binding subunit